MIFASLEEEKICFYFVSRKKSIWADIERLINEDACAYDKIESYIKYGICTGKANKIVFSFFPAHLLPKITRIPFLPTAHKLVLERSILNTKSKDYVECPVCSEDSIVIKAYQPAMPNNIHSVMAVVLFSKTTTRWWCVNCEIYI